MSNSTKDIQINVTLTEGEIGVINCSLEAYLSSLDEETKLNSGVVSEIHQIMDELELAVDDSYNQREGYYGGSM